VIVRVAALTILWVALYGEVSVGNVVGGLVVAGVLVALFPTSRPSVRHVRPWGALKLGWYVFVSLITSTWAVVVAVLFPRPDRVEATVKTVHVSTRSATAMTLMGNLITLTPGTMTVDLDERSGLMHVHILGRVDDDEFAESMARLERKVTAALALKETA
jgi:multicomponent Na+:H+ antiporter subunit E